jgi:hypothetical protein
MKKIATKLVLRRETLVQLRRAELRQAVGGFVDSTPHDNCTVALALLAVATVDPCAG